jgi:hypothetical protein
MVSDCISDRETVGADTTQQLIRIRNPIVELALKP